jgi:hypothetical protein
MAYLQTELGIDMRTVVARGKLPDDLTIAEYSDLVTALFRLSTRAERNARGGASGKNQVRPQTVLVRSQYGSDFLVILGIVGMVSAGAGGVAGAFLGFSKALKVLAEAGLANEQRLSLKDERLERREARLRAAAPVPRPELNVTFTHPRILSEQLRRQVDNELGGSQDEETYISLTQLAEYGITLDIED